MEREILDVLPDDVRIRLEQELAESQQAKQIKTELQDFVKKVYSKPELKKQFENFVKQVDPNIQLPQTPLDTYVEPLKQEINSLKNNLEIEKKRQEAYALMKQYGISEQEVAEVDKFMSEYNISDPLKALKLYAERKMMTMDSSVPTNPIEEIKNPTDLNSVRNNVIQQLKIMRRGF